MVVPRTDIKAAWLRILALCAALFVLAVAQTATGQVRTIDPDAAIDGDLMTPEPTRGEPPADGPDAPITGIGTIDPDDVEPAESQPTYDRSEDAASWSGGNDVAAPPAQSAARPGVADWNPQDVVPPDAGADGRPEDLVAEAQARSAANDDGTYQSDDLIGAAEGVFGDAAQGVAKLIEDLLASQGRPNAYIVGREGGGAFILGVRYGSGTLYHKVEGERPVYWTGPSVGFDVGANAGNTFVLVYNLYDTQDLYRRFPAGEGQAYLIGGLTVSYMRRGDIVLIPIRAGAGLRLGVNAGYMRFSEQQRWSPF